MNLRYILIRWIISAAAILMTTWLVPGIKIEGNGIIIASIAAVVLGFVNAVIRPILILLSCGCIVITLGLFLLVINATALYFASQISQWLGFGFYVEGFWPALIGSIVISIITWLLSIFLIGDKERP